MVAEKLEDEWHELKQDALAVQRAEHEGRPVEWPALERRQRHTPALPAPPPRALRSAEGLAPEVRMRRRHACTHAGRLGDACTLAVCRQAQGRCSRCA